MFIQSCCHVFMADVLCEVCKAVKNLAKPPNGRSRQKLARQAHPIRPSHRRKYPDPDIITHQIVPKVDKKLDSRPGFHTRSCSPVAGCTLNQMGKWAILFPDNTHTSFSETRRVVYCPHHRTQHKSQVSD